MPAFNSFRLESTVDSFNLIIFLFVGCGISILSERLRSAVMIADRRGRTTEALLESAAQGIIGVTEDGRISVVNTMTQQMFGYSREELLGQPLEILLPEDKRAIHRTHRRSFHANPHARPMGLGLALSGRRKDASEFPAEVSLSSVVTEDGRLSVAFVTDIALRQRAEEAFRHQAEMLNLAADPIFTWVMGGAISYWNRGAEILYGYTASEAIGCVSHTLLQTQTAAADR